jgi:hypothetical protein
MNDDFIYRMLPEVPESFRRSLYQRISSPEASSTRIQHRHRSFRLFRLVSPWPSP